MDSLIYTLFICTKHLKLNIIGENLRAGVSCMLQSAGLGKLKPNTMIIGYMNRWQSADSEQVEEYFHIIHDAFSLRYGVGILRLQDGFDITDELRDDAFEDGVIDNQEPDWYTEDWDENQKQTSAQGNLFFIVRCNLRRQIYKTIINYYEHSLHIFNISKVQTSGNITVCLAEVWADMCCSVLYFACLCFCPCLKIFIFI